MIAREWEIVEREREREIEGKVGEKKEDVDMQVLQGKRKTGLSKNK